MKNGYFAALLLISLFLAGCREGRTPDELPTRIPSIQQLATSEFLTANAPPEGYRGTVDYTRIDAQLRRLSNWHAEAVLNFNGVFSGTPREVETVTQASIWHNLLGQQRRVVIEGAGELLNAESDTVMEGVRLGDDTFLVRDGVCLGDASGQAAVVADLLPADLVGGVSAAEANGMRATLNGQQVWRYQFDASALQLPMIRTTETSQVTMDSGELWIAPDAGAVIRFYLSLNVENVYLTPFDNSLPLTGILTLRYDLYDIGIDPNITQPFGC